MIYSVDNVHIYDVKPALFLSRQMSAFFNDAFINRFTIPTKWYALSRLRYIESMYILHEQVSYEVVTR